MHILVTNDDGLWAQGIQALVAGIPDEYKVSVVALPRPRAPRGTPSPCTNRYGQTGSRTTCALVLTPGRSRALPSTV